MRQYVSGISPPKEPAPTSSSRLIPDRIRPPAPRPGEPVYAGQVQGHSFGDIPVHPPPTAQPSSEFRRREILLPSPVGGQARHPAPELQWSISKLGPGQPLPPVAGKSAQGLSEVPLDGLRVHDVREGHLMARALDSEAFTVGNHIVLGDPTASNTPRDRLLAHEIAHAIQQHPQKTGHTSNDAEREADRFAEQVVASAVRKREAAPSLGVAPIGLAPKVIKRITRDLPQDRLLIIDIDDGDFVGGCVKEIVPHVGVKLIKKGVPKAEGNEVFNIHVGFMRNKASEYCIFFYESVSGKCETKCYPTELEMMEAIENEVREWLDDLVASILKGVLMAILIALGVASIVATIVGLIVEGLSILPPLAAAS